MKYSDFEATKNNMAYKNADNVFSGMQTIVSSQIGTGTPGLKIIAGTDQNPHSRACIGLNNYGSVEATIFLEIDGTLKFRTGENVRTFNMS